MAHVQVIQEPLEAGTAAGAFDVADPETSAAAATGARRGRDGNQRRGRNRSAPRA